MKRWVMPCKSIVPVYFHQHHMIELISPHPYQQWALSFLIFCQADKQVMISHLFYCANFVLFVKVTVYRLTYKHPYFHSKGEIWVDLKGWVEFWRGNFRGRLPWGHLGKWFLVCVWGGWDFVSQAVSGDIFGTQNGGAQCSWHLVNRSQGRC